MISKLTEQRLLQLAAILYASERNTSIQPMKEVLPDIPPDASRQVRRALLRKEQKASVKYSRAFMKRNKTAGD